MKALKIIGVILLIFIALVLIIPLFLADTVTVTQSVLIKAKPVTIFHQVNTLKNWDKWSPFDDDPEMKVTYAGAESGVGAEMVWSGMENGSLTIVESEPYKHIVTDIDYGQDGTTNGIWSFEDSPEGVKVSWTTMMKDLSYPVERSFGLAMEIMMQNMLEKGLNDLKAVAEDMENPPEITIVNTQATTAIVMYDSTTIDGIADLLGKNYRKLMNYVARKKIPMTGQPFAVYHNWDPKGIIRISAGIPVAHIPERLKKSMKAYELPAGRAVFAKHLGGYNTSKTHWAIDTYMKDFNLKPKDFIWEVYVTDPATEPDSTKWETDIYYPLK
jgi:effector-binding domain-containing protein